jgi:hypothetical protein
MKKSYLFPVLVLTLAALFLSACGAQLPAGVEIKPSIDGTSATVEFVGKVGDMQADSWQVEGQTVLVNNSTVINGNFAAGDMVKVEALVDSNGVVTALKIGPANDQSEQAEGNSSSLEGNFDEFTGKVDNIAADAWLVKGQNFIVNAQTEIKDNILVGDVVKVHFLTGADGVLTATEISLAGNNQAHNSESDGQQDDELEIVGSVESVSPWIVAGTAFATTPQTEIKGQFVVGDVVKVHLYTAPDGILTAREIEHAKSDDLSGLDNDEEMKIIGVLSQVDANQIVVGGKVILITNQTRLDDGLVLGSQVKVEVVMNPDGSLTATNVETEDRPSSANTQSGNSSGSSSSLSSSGGNSSSTSSTDDEHEGSGNSGSGSSSSSSKDGEDD